MLCTEAQQSRGQNVVARSSHDTQYSGGESLEGKGKSESAETDYREEWDMLGALYY